MDYNVSTGWTIALAAVIIWELAWKGFALWRASQRKQPWWFAVILLINSAGVLPILYLLTHRLSPATEERLIHEQIVPITR
jgi:hypothetical protein